jgi:hypothetical protein
MMRQIVLPAALLLGCLVGAFGFFLWDEFHAQWGHNNIAEDADAGNLVAQRRLASCYATGCLPNFGPEPVLACAWREIIVKEAKRASRDDLSAQQKACSQISGPNVLTSAEDDIFYRMRRIHQTQSGPRPADAGTLAHDVVVPGIAPMAPHPTGLTARRS